MPVPTEAGGNRSVYESAGVVAEYASLAREASLFPSEQAILDRLARELAAGALLDVGVGAGRTSRALSRACRSYVGIDYSESMIRRCRSDFPGLEFQQQDARDLGAFSAATFDAAWFSFNGIDYVPLDDRALVFREISRVLKPGGAFIFSTHNLHAPPRPPPTWPEWRREGSTVRRHLSNLRRLFRHAGYHANYRRSKNRQQFADGAALLVDSAHGYRLMTACVTPEFQARQAAAAGFCEVEVFAQDGQRLGVDARPADSWLYYVARKRA